MARKISGHSKLPDALKAAGDAQTADELRVALAVSLPLQHGLSLKETSKTIGRSLAWVTKHRRRFFDGHAIGGSVEHGGRRNQLIPGENEAEFMENLCLAYVKGTRGWISSRTNTPEITAMMDMKLADHVKNALELLTGRSVSLTSAYNLMARVGRKKFDNYSRVSWRDYCHRLSLS